MENDARTAYQPPKSGYSTYNSTYNFPGDHTRPALHLFQLLRVCCCRAVVRLEVLAVQDFYRGRQVHMRSSLLHPTPIMHIACTSVQLPCPAPAAASPTLIGSSSAVFHNIAGTPGTLRAQHAPRPNPPVGYPSDSEGGDDRRAARNYRQSSSMSALVPPRDMPSRAGPQEMVQVPGPSETEN